MPLRILLVAATENEAGILKMIKGVKSTSEGYAYNGHDVKPLITGIGSVATAWNLTRSILTGPKPDLAINIGIAGSFRKDIRLGEVVIPVSDCFADAGVETGKRFLTLAESGLEDPDKFPFRGGRIYLENSYSERAIGLFKPVNAITVNTSTGTSETAEKLSGKYSADIETMEGAAFFYICCREDLPFLALRSVSNLVELRDKDKWDIKLALNKLQEGLKEVLLLY